jgi:hypothetical protein
MNTGDPVARKDDPRHTGRVIGRRGKKWIKVKWDGTAWISWERLDDLELIPEWREDRVASHRVPNIIPFRRR